MNMLYLNTELGYLLDTYFHKENWHDGKLNEQQAEEHFSQQLERDNITFMKGNEDDIVGYLEIYWLDNRQLGKIINRKFFDVLAEDLTKGDFVYVASAYLEPEFRNKGYIDDLKRMMKDKHKDHDYIGIIYEEQNRGTFKFYKKGEI